MFKQTQLLNYFIGGGLWIKLCYCVATGGTFIILEVINSFRILLLKHYCSVIVIHTICFVWQLETQPELGRVIYPLLNVDWQLLLLSALGLVILFEVEAEAHGGIVCVLPWHAHHHGAQLGTVLNFATASRLTVIVKFAWVACLRFFQNLYWCKLQQVWIRDIFGAQLSVWRELAHNRLLWWIARWLDPTICSLGGRGL